MHQPRRLERYQYFMASLVLQRDQRGTSTSWRNQYCREIREVLVPRGITSIVERLERYQYLVAYLVRSRRSFAWRVTLSRGRGRRRWWTAWPPPAAGAPPLLPPRRWPATPGTTTTCASCPSGSAPENNGVQTQDLIMDLQSGACSKVPQLDCAGIVGNLIYFIRQLPMHMFFVSQVLTTLIIYRRVARVINTREGSVEDESFYISTAIRVLYKVYTLCGIQCCGPGLLVSTS